MGNRSEIKFPSFKSSTSLIKKRFEKIKTYVETISHQEEPTTPQQLKSLSIYSAELTKKRDEFDSNLQRLLDSSTQDIPVDDVSALQDDIHDLFTDITSLIETITPIPSSPDGSTIESSQTTSSASHIKLPKLELKHFDGSPLQWVSFINLFDTSIHGNSSLPNVAKFQYLLSVISGEALNLVKSLNITDANYTVAYNLLRDRYHNTRRLTTLHLNQILDLPNVTSSSIKNLRMFVNLFYEHSQALKALECDITSDVNPLLSALILRKMDHELCKKLEVYRSTQLHGVPHTLPDVECIIKFLNTECIHVEDASLHNSSSKVYQGYNSKPLVKPNPSLPKRNQFSSQNVTLLSTNNPDSSQSNVKHSCFICNCDGHKVYSCSLFRDKTPNERYEIIKSHKRCISCLGNHNIKNCGSKGTCLKCQKRHHTMLHFPPQPAYSGQSQCPQPETNSSQAVKNNSVSLTAQENYSSSTHTSSHSTVLLGTTLVKLKAENGHTHVFRALLDTGSMCDFLSERAAQLLGVNRHKSNVVVVGLSQTSANTKGMTHLNVETLSGRVMATHHPFHILNKITVDLPRARISPDVLKLVKPYTLADPTFHLPSGIDVLLGGGILPLLLTNNSHSLGPNLPYVVGTHFGYVVMGQAPCVSPSAPISTQAVTLLSTSDLELHTSLQRFWQQEEPPLCTAKNAEELLCDELFVTTHSREADGRYVVRLPFKPDHPPLGNSYISAQRRLNSLENRFRSNTTFHHLYNDVMKDYISQGHMVKVDDLDFNSPHYYLPHHGVLKEASSTTKLRTVFDASCKTSSGVSLNDILLSGPKLQNNICDILIHFRVHNIVFSCDVKQMYRMIKVHPDDQMFQLVLWRDNTSDKVSTYKLTRVTFGINSSPYLAIKTLHQLAEDEGRDFPRAAEVLKNHTYVDDILAGGVNEEDAAQLQDQLIQLLKRGGFELRKWISNSSKLLQNLPQDHLESPQSLQASQPHFSILGLYWSPVDDKFTYNINLPQETPTKRNVLSLIAKIYDPCGFLAPCLMMAKCFMQLLWTTGLGWDSPLPPDISEKWLSFISDAKCISHISIPRAFQLSLSSHTELHGFSDASENGFAAVVYLRCQLTDGTVLIRQIVAKTRVAPLKRVTVPRLELCGAHLLAQLMSYCKTQFNHIDIAGTYLWCDSTVVLTWLQTPPYRLKTYVANRVSQSQELVPPHCWRYIRSAQNPADCASRGILPSQLIDHPLWWSGPEWLRLPHSDWPSSQFSPVDLSSSEETKTTPVVVLTSTPQEEWDLLSKFSTWSRLCTVMAYILRFIHNCRRPNKLHGHLSTSEMKGAQLQIFKNVQQVSFADELCRLQKNNVCSARLQRLSPFLDSDGLLRVGGRLNRSNLPNEVRHPAVLPKSHHVVNLLIDYFHRSYLHSGPQLTQSLLSQQVWILSARSAIRSRIFKCVQCFKAKPKNRTPLMGDLPPTRVTPARPFLATGLDYCGPFNVKIHNLRTVRHTKVYICIFICMVTKAVHLEVVTDLTTEAFIASLTRFVSRRGLCTDIYSDCGTNFVGADAFFRKLRKDTIYHSASQAKIHDFASFKGIKFHFNPPAAPHHGGLWESAVKSAKHHLRRVVGDTALTLAQFSTLSTQVEAMLNSRPLTPLPTDPAEASALTPGHFLIGAPLASLPEPDATDIPNNRLNSWQLVQAFNQRIWRRWQLEYLQTLQQRSKWAKPTANLKVGDVVLVHSPTPPLTWPLARVTALHPGSDGVVRVVDLKTAKSTLRRPVVKVFPLPLD